MKKFLAALAVAAAVVIVVLWAIAREEVRTDPEEDLEVATGTASETSAGDERARPNSGSAAVVPANATGAPVPSIRPASGVVEPRSADRAGAGAVNPAADQPPPEPESEAEARLGESAAPQRFGVTRDGIKAAIQSVLPGIRDCYQSWVQLTPNVGGKIVVKFRIAPADNEPKRGIIAGAKIAETQLQHEILEGCILNAMQDVEFEDPPAEGLDVNYPFIFSNDEDGGMGADAG